MSSVNLPASALISIAFGALAGGVTNAIAIWMLFHPYEPPRLGRWTLTRIQGAVPKNQARLAAAIGRTVGGRLLTEEDLTRTFAREEFRVAFDERLGSLVQSVLHQERGPVRELLIRMNLANPLGSATSASEAARFHDAFKHGQHDVPTSFAIDVEARTEHANLAAIE